MRASPVTRTGMRSHS